MKVAFVLPTKSYGGIERTLVTLVHEFRRRGIAIVIGMLRDSEIPYPEELPGDLEIHYLGTRSKLDGIGKVIRFLRACEPDVVISSKDHGNQVVLLAAILGRLDARIYVTVTNMWSRVIRRPVQRAFVRWLYPRADGIIAVSRGVKTDLCHAFGVPESMVRVIYNPVTPGSVDGPGIGVAPHEWLARDTSVPVILGIGRLEPQKDFPTLLRAFSRLHRQRRCRLLILGEGSQRGALESLARELGAEDDVAFPGRVASATPYLERAALFVLSSRWEGFGIVLAEALAAGTPVVSTDCPSGPAEIVEYGRHGPLVPVGDAAALAEAMERTLANPPSREALRAAAGRFDAARIAAEYLEYLGEGSGRHCP